jgi:hypothetical protein
LPRSGIVTTGHVRRAHLVSNTYFSHPGRPTRLNPTEDNRRMAVESLTALLIWSGIV